MIDLFAIFGKGGIVLWYFQGTRQFFTPSINTLIREVFLQERGNVSTFNHNNLTMKFKLDNEFELIFLAVYQNVIQLSYVDKLLSDIHREFRDQYKNVLTDRSSLFSLCGSDYFDEFDDVFKSIYSNVQENTKNLPQKAMRTFEESSKSQKTVASMIQQPATTTSGKQATKPSQIPIKEKSQSNASGKATTPTTMDPKKDEKSPMVETTNFPSINGDSAPISAANDDDVARKRKEFIEKQQGGKGKGGKSGVASKPDEKQKKTKQMRHWPGEAAGVDMAELDFSVKKTDGNGQSKKSEDQFNEEELRFIKEQEQFVGKSKQLGDVEYESDTDTDEESDEENQAKLSSGKQQKGAAKPAAATSGGGSRFAIFSAFKSLVGSKQLTEADLVPGLEKMKDHLIAKNVAADIADKLCQSVSAKLAGKSIGTFSGVTKLIKDTLRESLVQILTPNRRIDILRDILEVKRQRRPYVIVFCGVNGVGKSTNLAKITFWLNENGHKVMIAACDTFRAGAVEQLRTHTRHLNALHPNSVHLYEQGYGKDAAAVAAQAVINATDMGIDVVLVDTAGRMQDNQPLMISLAKLIKVNNPDLVLFVGEALVGNEAVDQLTKFNQALADQAAAGSKARLIDGIVLTKFDTIDDKVGAAISMTYITGQPIVFVGTGQTYHDLKNLNANAVVHSLMK